MPTPGTIDPNQPFGDITSLVDLIKNISGTQSDTNGTTQTAPGDQANALLAQVLERILPGMDSGQYSPDAAVKDSQGLVDQIMQSYRESTLPNIYQAERSGGGYNSTTAQLLANDAMAKASAQGAAQVSSTKEKYAQITNQQQQQLVNVLLGLIAANKKSTTTQSTTAGKPAGSPLGNIGKALGAAAASNAAKKATALPKKTPDAQQGKTDQGRNSDENAEANDEATGLGKDFQNSDLNAESNDEAGTISAEAFQNSDANAEANDETPNFPDVGGNESGAFDLGGTTDFSTGDPNGDTGNMDDTFSTDTSGLDALFQDNADNSDTSDTSDSSDFGDNSDSYDFSDMSDFDFGDEG
jgi:hypothetical protein